MEEAKKTSVETASVPTQADQSQKPKSVKKIYILIAFSVFFVLTAIISKNYFLPNEILQNPIRTLFLSIENPKQEATIVNGEVLIEGKTLPNTAVVIYTDTDETSLQSDIAGNFKDTVIVGDQGGLVKITAFSDSGIEVSRTLDIKGNVLGKSDKAQGGNVENEGGRGNSDNNQGNSNKEDKGNQKQGQNQTQSQSQQTQTTKVKSQKPPTVSDFLSNKVKIEKAEKMGAKKMLDILSEESTEGAQLKKNLKFKKMEASQASGGAQMKRHAVSGVITQISGGVIILAHQIQRERTHTIYYNDSTVITMKDGKDNTSSKSATPTPGSGTESGVLAVSTESATPSSGVLTVGMRIAVVGIPSEGGLLATRIHVIPGKAIGVFNRQPVSSGSATPTITIGIPPTGTVSATPTEAPTPTEIPTPTP